MAKGLKLKLSMNVGTCMMQKVNSLSFDEAVVSILSAYAVTKLRHSWHSEQYRQKDSTCSALVIICPENKVDCKVYFIICNFTI